MVEIESVHHIAIICSNYEVSRHFYTEILGLQVLRETYREERNSYKLDLSLNGNYILELFSFPDPPPRPSRPEAQGLRHLAFAVRDIGQTVKTLVDIGREVEDIRVDDQTGKKFTFIADPDGLPIEFYES